MLAHGVNHIVGGGKIAGTAGWFESLGMRPGRSTPVAAHRGRRRVLLLVGLATSLEAGGALGVMVVAWVTNHRGNGFFIFRPGEGWEYVMTWLSRAWPSAALGPAVGRSTRARPLTDTFSGASGLAIAAAPASAAPRPPRRVLAPPARHHLLTLPESRGSVSSCDTNRRDVTAPESAATTGLRNHRTGYGRRRWRSS